MRSDRLTKKDRINSTTKNTQKSGEWINASCTCSCCQAEVDQTLYHIKEEKNFAHLPIRVKGVRIFLFVY